MPINPLPEIDYNLNVKTPFESFLGGYQTGAGLAQMQAKTEQARLEAERLRQAQQEMQNFWANPNPTMRDAARAASYLPKEQADALRPYIENMNKEQQQSTLQFGNQVLYALRSPNPEVGVKLLRDRAEAERNAGREDQAKAYEHFADSAEREGPSGAFKVITALVGHLPGAKEAFEASAKAEETQRGVEKAPFELTKAEAEAKIKQSEANVSDAMQQAGLDEKKWNIKNVRSQIADRSARLNLDSKKTAAEVAEKLANAQAKITEIPASAHKEINDSATSSVMSKQLASQYNDLAGRITGIGGGYGAFGSLAEFLKKSAGYQGGVTELRNEYSRIRNSAAIKSLPPGPATDRDIELALKGFPPETADPKVIQRFLTGMAKMNDIDAAVQGAKTDWLTNNKGLLGRANRDFTAGDYSVRQGETFPDFSQRVATEINNKYKRGATGAPTPAPAAPTGTSGQRSVTVDF